MRELIEGSQAIAETVLRCRPEVVPAYPITPQTHIVERIGRLLKQSAGTRARFLTVESEFAAMSVAIGASAAGSRTYTATASQGLLYMAEALFNAAGLSLPIVLTVANRAIGAPINIWNDQSDSMSMRDCGWIQLYAQDNQQAVDLHVLAFRLAEQLSVPVMVCVDGFVLTHAFEPLEVPAQDLVDDFLPALVPEQLLAPAEPMTIGAMVGPEAFTEVRYLAYQQHAGAIELLPELSAAYQQRTGRAVPALSCYRTEDADLIALALGSVTGTLRAAVDQARQAGHRIGLVGLTLYRPFPDAQVRAALGRARRVVVLERAMAAGAGGAVTADVRAAVPGLPVHTLVAGLGGRAVSEQSLATALIAMADGRVDGMQVLDLRTDVVERESARRRAAVRPGPAAVNLLRDSAPGGSRIH
ncbi:MAG TPA: hypothetical protein VHO01_15450 [Jatrophihabitans sp.]|nr:hypothetical protein [Jatrophihabitans sp.]